jgi:WD40 repeat protein
MSSMPARVTAAEQKDLNPIIGRRLHDELLDGEIFYSLAEARIIIESWLRHYNTERPHGHDGEVASAAFSPDGKVILTASDDKTARLWDAAKGQSIGERLTGHDGEVSSAAFSLDDRRIVTSSDKTVRVWDAATGQPIGEPLRGHDDQVESAGFSPDGNRIVTASRDTGAAIGKPAARRRLKLIGGIRYSLR